MHSSVMSSSYHLNSYQFCWQKKKRTAGDIVVDVSDPQQDVQVATAELHYSKPLNCEYLIRCFAEVQIEHVIPLVAVYIICMNIPFVLTVTTTQMPHNLDATQSCFPVTIKSLKNDQVTRQSNEIVSYTDSRSEKEDSERESHVESTCA